MSEKRIQQIERRIDRIKEELLEIGPMRPGSLTRQYKDPPTQDRGLLADQLHPPDEEPDGVRPRGMDGGDPPPDRHPQAVQTPGRPVDRPEHRTLTADHADCRTGGNSIGWNSVLSSNN